MNHGTLLPRSPYGAACTHHKNNGN